MQPEEETIYEIVYNYQPKYSYIFLSIISIIFILLFVIIVIKKYN